MITPLVIFDFVPGAPAEQSGLRKGDRIIKVDGVPVEGMTMETVANKISGKENTTGKITVGRSDVEGKSAENTVIINRTRLGFSCKDS
jgi:Periplasmic protease